MPAPAPGGTVPASGGTKPNDPFEKSATFRDGVLVDLVRVLQRVKEIEH